MTQNPKQRPVRVGLVSLGCAKNLVDGEIMLGSLLKDGAEITNDPEQADVLILNTCSFIDSAQEESVDAILEAAELRDAKNRGQALIVAGCLPQRFRDELPSLLPEVDGFMGVDEVPRVAELVKQAIATRAARSNEGKPQSRGRAKRKLGEVRGAGGGQQPAAQPAAVDVSVRPRYIPDYATPRFRLTPRHFAYVKIAEGCNHPCSFCTIPRMRGAHRSRPQADIVAEAKALLADGVRELNLISQDSTYYGLDLRPDRGRAAASPGSFAAAVQSLPAKATTLCTLLRELNAMRGEFWIRLLYTHPAHWTDELIRTIAECPKVARYVDIPLQHIHGNMLERMRRETSRQHIVDLLGRIRAGIPGISLRTTFIVGFPGETEAYYESLLEFIRETKFERLGVFAYSREESTRAGAMAGQVSEGVKRRRRERAMAVQREVVREVSRSFVGRSIRVLVEGEASARQLRDAAIRSREHGLMRSGDAGVAAPKASRCWVARGEADAPDIDGRVYVLHSRAVGAGAVRPGEFVEVRVVGHTDYDLVAVCH
jgi:ribosomal protein S12 methylthiotransferase